MTLEKERSVDKKRISSIHEWVNSVATSLAILLSCGSLYITWDANLRKAEQISINSRPTDNCKPDLANYIVAQCWVVTISNISEDQLSVIQYDARVRGIVYWKSSLLDQDGKRLPLPFSLSGGEAKAVIIRVAFYVDADAHALFDQLRVKFQKDGKSPLMTDVSRELAGKRTDVFGAPVIPKVVNGEIIGWDYNLPGGPLDAAHLTSQDTESSGPTLITVDIDIKTGRGSDFRHLASYPTSNSVFLGD
jgi:hypothetical protein